MVDHRGHTYFLQRFIIDETRGVLGYFELPLLNMLAEFPVKPQISAIAQSPQLILLSRRKEPQTGRAYIVGRYSVYDRLARVSKV